MMTDKKKEYEYLFTTYFQPFCLYANRFIGDMDVCKNIVSDIFVKVWEKRKELNFEKDIIIPYITTGVRNSCFNHFRSINAKISYQEFVTKQKPNYSDSPEHIYTLNELYEVLNSVLNDLPHVYKEVFIKEFFEHKKQYEIAQELNISPRSVHRYKTIVLERLRKIVGKHWADVIIIAILASDTSPFIRLG